MQTIAELNKKIFNKNFRFVFLIIFLFELISLSGYLMPWINTIGFFAILALILIFSLKNLKYGILAALIELFIGGKGYLFFFNLGGATISIRIAIWLIIMAVYLTKLISCHSRPGSGIQSPCDKHWIPSQAEEKVNCEAREATLGCDTNELCHSRIPSVIPAEARIQFSHFNYFKNNNLHLFIILFLFLIWGIINAIINDISWNNVFFDFNAWLFFAYIFPLAEVIKQNNFIEGFLQSFFVSTIWLCFKTLALLFIFSHNLIGIVFEIYRWIRVTGVGEITNVDSGFIRIFFQSHLFVLIGFFVILFIFNQFFFRVLPDRDRKSNLTNKYFWIYFLLLTLFSSIIIISFSRSFWVGIFLSFIIYLIIAFKKYGLKKTFFTLLILLLSIISSIGIIALIIKFPYPDPSANFNISQLTDRVSKFKNESAVSSRYALLPPLMSEITKHPILGAGFGKTVTYKSSDPRVLEQTTDGSYTTYAFEWGWLDIWLKIGIIGTIFYLFLIGKIIKNGLAINNWLSLSLSIGLILVVITSIFSPYTNHPLGIGYIILCNAIFIKNS